MNKRILKLIIFIITMLTCILGLVACNKNANDTKYTVTWKNYDGTILETDMLNAYRRSQCDISHTGGKRMPGNSYVIFDGRNFH